MDIFGDKQYENMDWLTKATEPITYSITEKLNEIPKEFVVDYDVLMACMDEYGFYIKKRKVFDYFIAKLNIKLTPLEREEYIELYQFTIPADMTIDLETGISLSSGQKPIIFSRVKDVFTEEDLKEKLGEAGYKKLRDISWDEADSSRMKEIIDLLGDKDIGDVRTPYKRCRAIAESYHKIMRNMRWNIRSVDLSNKVADWIYAYIVKGDLAAMTNFCRLKAITHRGYPIYNLEDEA